jgi:hypothetical protein
MTAEKQTQRRAARLSSNRGSFCIFISDDVREFTRRRRAARLRSKARRFQAHVYVAKFRK